MINFFKQLRNGEPLGKFADKLGINRSTLYRIEHGEILPTSKTLMRYWRIVQPDAKTFLINAYAIYWRGHKSKTN